MLNKPNPKELKKVLLCLDINAEWAKNTEIPKHPMENIKKDSCLAKSINTLP